MKHVRIQIDPTQSQAALEALDGYSLPAMVDGDMLRVYAHDDGLQVERILKQAGIHLFSAAEICDGSGY